MPKQKRNWFETLNEALASEGLIHTWDPLWRGIEYGENRIYIYKHRCISIFRENDGRYERPVHYSTK